MTVESDPMFKSPALAAPYAGTTGFVPVEQSRQAAERDAKSGLASARQASILGMLKDAGDLGLTSAEIENKSGMGHGKVSGALSSMHKEGLIVALKFVRRNNCGVYVMPENVVGRIERPFVSLADSKADRPAPPTPVAQAKRQRLTDEELRLTGAIREALPSHTDQPFMRLKPSTVKALLAALDRLNA